MKKQTLLFVAGSMLAFASCNTATPEGGASQAQIDSTVNARVEEIRTELMAQNDSLINALAIQKADSILADMKANGGTIKKTTTTTVKPTKGTSTTTTTTTKPVVSEPTNTGKNTGEAGVNTGKKGNQTDATNTGKK